MSVKHLPLNYLLCTIQGIYNLTIYDFLDSLELRRAFNARSPIYLLFSNLTIYISPPLEGLGEAVPLEGLWEAVPLERDGVRLLR